MDMHTKVMMRARKRARKDNHNHAIAAGHPSKLTYTRFSKRHRPETDVRHTKPRPAKIAVLAFRFFGYAGHFRGRCGENTGPGWLCSCRECGRFPCEIQWPEGCKLHYPLPPPPCKQTCPYRCWIVQLICVGVKAWTQVR